MISARFDPIERDIRALITEVTSPAARSAMLADMAREEIAKASAGNRAALGFDPGKQIFVDGREGAPLQAVRPDGTIVATWDLSAGMFSWIEQMLIQHSPVLTGRYSKSHVLVVDGVALDPGAPIPPGWREASWTNTQPYSRKLERGLSDKASAIYQTVAVLAAKRFGRVARIRFGFETPLFGAVDEWAAATRKGRSRRDRDRAARQPAILMRAL